MRNAKAFVAVVVLAVMFSFLGGCAVQGKTGSPKNLSPDQSRVMVEARALMVSENLLDVVGLEIKSSDLAITAINDFTLSLMVQATQADARSVLFTAPRITLPLSAMGTVGFDKLLSLDLKVDALSSEGLAMTLSKIQFEEGAVNFSSANGPVFFWSGKLIVKPGLPVQVKFSGGGNALVTGIQFEHSDHSRIEPVIVLLRVRKVVGKEVESPQGWPGDARPTSLPAAR